MFLGREIWEGSRTFGAHVTEVSTTGWLNKRNLLSHGSGGQKPKIKALAVLAPSEGCDHLIALTL